jgi:glycosyltransferase involved in cell wall biosynthesis
MKVVHVCSVVGSGGAAHSMLNLHRGLLSLGIESVILAESCRIEDERFVETAHRPETRKSLDRANWDLVWNNRTDLSNTHFSLDLFGQLVAGHPLIANADVINLHWTSGFLSSVSLAQLACLRKPVVWTLHDIHPLTGGCHFPSGCRRFHETCGDCPQLNVDHWEMTERTHTAMSAAVSLVQPHYVAPSEWMRQNIRNSGISSSSPVSRIAYGVDSTVFKPGRMRDARKELGLADNCWYILLASHSLDEKRKGAAYAIDILQKIRSSEAASEAVASGKLRLLCCGHDTGKLIIDGWVIDRLGFVTSATMALIYQCANALLFTSIEDNLPNVIMEAMACGLPVVGHAVGGAVDLLGGENPAGLLFELGDAEGGSERILRLFLEEKMADELAVIGIKKITDHYSIGIQAEKYQDLYKQLIEENHRAGPNSMEFVAEGAREQVAISFEHALENEKSHAANLSKSNRLLADTERNLARSVSKVGELQGQLSLLRKNWWIKLGKLLRAVPGK